MVTGARRVLDRIAEDFRPGNLLIVETGGGAAELSHSNDTYTVLKKKLLGYAQRAWRTERSY